jgi:beta-phosphoglucomutase-like phosphatase (HAD superfamily)
VTPPIDDPEAVRRILATTEALFLDFDGPVCSVFAGFPAPVVADQLRDILIEGGHDIPDDVRDSTDPFGVLFYAVKLGPEEARYVEAAFRAHEVEAVQSAEPTPQAHALIKAWRASGRPLAIVSNNSVAAVETYLDMHELRQVVDLISARANADLSLLKPSPYLVTSAANVFKIAPSFCAFVGDSVTDIDAAKLAKVRSIAYVNKPGKLEQFKKKNPEAIVHALLPLVSAVTN